MVTWFSSRSTDFCWLLELCFQEFLQRTAENTFFFFFCAVVSILPLKLCENLVNCENQLDRSAFDLALKIAGRMK